VYIIQLNKVDLCCMKEKEKLPFVLDYYSINVFLTMYFFFCFVVRPQFNLTSVAVFTKPHMTFVLL
jgi:hypothetical protein